jgi:SNF2 family DNA or RNA helicase
MSLLPPFPSFVYHPHQVEGVEWMIHRETDATFCAGGILADEMGLGKTWETIGLLLNNPVPQTLILMPPVLQNQWSEALTRASIAHTILHPKAAYWGQWQKVKVAEPRDGIHVVLATYDRASRVVESLNEKGFDRILCDEGHALRNGPSTRRFQELAKLEAMYRWILSGTPVQNKLSDFHNLLTWLHCDYDRKTTPVSEIAGELLLRRTVADVKERDLFPECKPTHFIHPVSMPEDSEEKQVFDRLVRRFQDAVEDKVQAFLILELYLRIRQFLAHPQMYVSAMVRKYKDEYKRQVWTSSASKMAAFETFLATSEKKPTIVFTQFRDEMDYAEEALKRCGFRTWKIAGGMTDSVRTSAIQATRNAVKKGESVAMLIQIQAGNAGLNLQHLHRIVFLSSHWNPAVMDQAVARAYRIGQTEQVEVHHILLADGAEKNLDRYILHMHGKKRTFATRIHDKLFCDAAVDVEYVIDTLNEVCPPDVEVKVEEEEEEEE